MIFVVLLLIAVCGAIARQIYRRSWWVQKQRQSAFMSEVCRAIPEINSVRLPGIVHPSSRVDMWLVIEQVPEGRGNLVLNVYRKNSDGTVGRVEVAAMTRSGNPAYAVAVFVSVCRLWIDSPYHTLEDQWRVHKGHQMV